MGWKDNLVAIRDVRQYGDVSLTPSIASGLFLFIHHRIFLCHSIFYGNIL